MTRISRRGFLGTAAALATLRTGRAAEDRYRLREFRYSDVTLTGGPLAAQYQRTKTHFLGLDEDRILKI